MSLEWIREATDIIKDYCESIEDPFLAEIYGVLLEADVQWLNAQTFVIGQLLNNPQIKSFSDSVEGWDSLDNKQKISKLFLHFNEIGALKKVREYMEKSPDVLPGPTPMHYDVPEVKEPYTGIEPEHWEQFKKSKVFDDLSQIFLNHL